MKDIDWKPQVNEEKKPGMNEQELRNAEMPWPKTPGELIDYVLKVCEENKDDYGTAVYAISLSAVAAFNFASHLVGASGCQASCADLDIIRRTRGLKCPFAIIKAQDMLYPQSNIQMNVERLLEEWAPWAKEAAQKKLQTDDEFASVGVIKHWMALVAIPEGQENKIPSSEGLAAAPASAGGDL